MSLSVALSRSTISLSAVLLALGGCGGMMAAKSSPSRSTAAAPGYGGGGYAPASASESHAAVDTGYGGAPSTSYGGDGGGYVAEPAPERPGLGTSWGEAVHAPISFAPFQRASAAPWAELLLHYNDAQGVRSHAAFLGQHPSPLEIPAGDGSLSVALVDEAGNILPGYAAAGRSLVIGNDGARYRILVRNGTTARFEVVASVDGLDVIDGQAADPNRRGYIVDPHDVLVIDGFRTSDAAVAAFRFGRVAESYAAQTTGDRNVGVIGMAIYAERGAVWTPGELSRRDSANPFPNRGYATPPR